ncbi:hypothetical protein LCGC14_2676440 [marine sediment metagenome]|uniref:Uncharacterized protein n=1 Tax=marine sediment metagenome TaxID=412755 RepID=A0A0F9AA52_9ZZZZ
MSKEKIRKVAIVGNHITSRDAPWDDEAFDFWIINGAIKDVEGKRVAKWFDLHDWSIANYTPDYLKHIPVKPAFDIVTMDEYPYREIMDRYGYLWENSIPMLMAYAGYLDYRHIYIFGCEGNEYTDAPLMAANLYHIMGALRQEGRKVYLCNYSQMDTGGLYGYKNLQKTRIPAGFEFKRGE